MCSNIDDCFLLWIGAVHVPLAIDYPIANSAIASAWKSGMHLDLLCQNNFGWKRIENDSRIMGSLIYIVNYIFIN